MQYHGPVLTVGKEEGRRPSPSGEGEPDRRPELGLLLVQLGFHVAAQFREALEPLGLEPRQVGMLRRLVSAEGQSQQALGRSLGINPNGMVFLVDDLEAHGLVERRRNPHDRRSNAIYLTAHGHQALEDAARATSHHGDGLARSLSAAERRQLTNLLRRVAEEQGIDQHGLPGPPPGRRFDRNA
jgi:DNA-binding MarR family transcriptional regulator